MLNAFLIHVDSDVDYNFINYKRHFQLEYFCLKNLTNNIDLPKSLPKKDSVIHYDD